MHIGEGKLYITAERPWNIGKLDAAYNKKGGKAMFGKFVREEKAQGAIEYILLAGGIIVAAIVIFAIYSSMTRSAATQLNESVGTKVNEMQTAIAAQNLSV